MAPSGPHSDYTAQSPKRRGFFLEILLDLPDRISRLLSAIESAIGNWPENRTATWFRPRRDEGANASPKGNDEADALEEAWANSTFSLSVAFADRALCAVLAGAPSMAHDGGRARCAHSD